MGCQKVKNKRKIKAGGLDTGRRGFLGALAAIGGAVVVTAQSKLTDGGLAPLVAKANPGRETPIVPPGAKSVKNFYTHCTACQLCIAVCPNGLLKPSTSLDRFMQPVMGYDNGSCRPECNRCSQVCPTGAIRPVTHAEKTDISIGLARLYLHDCIAVQGKAECGLCARHCPVQTISMMKLDSADESPDAPRRPVITESRCIGCGACENVCPVNPVSAIRVEGRLIHTEIS